MNSSFCRAWYNCKGGLSLKPSKEGVRLSNSLGGMRHVPRGKIDARKVTLHPQCPAISNPQKIWFDHQMIVGHSVNCASKHVGNI